MDVTATRPGRGPGRPRRVGVSAGVVAATIECVAVNGYDRTSLDDIAVAAGVAKTTIYRRWSGKSELALDALTTAIGEPPSGADTSMADIQSATLWLAGTVRDPKVRSLLLGVISEADHDPGFRLRLRARIRDPFTQRLSLAWNLDPDEVDLAFDLVVGTVLHRLSMHGTITDAETRAIAITATGLVAQWAGVH